MVKPETTRGDIEAVRMFAHLGGSGGEEGEREVREKGREHPVADWTKLH